MSKRKIIKIDESKCDGCGLCVPNCHEGALRIIGGKAKLVSEVFCDGLGACLGYCPKGAITIEEREAQAFDEKKVKNHMETRHEFKGCPGSRIIDLRDKVAEKKECHKDIGASEFRQWPVQIMLVPEKAPYLTGVDLLISADCVPFSYVDFHGDLLKGKTLLIGCPKLDDLQFYREKIKKIINNNDIRSVTYAHMEVPCCMGLIGVIEDAIGASGKDIPFEEVSISIKGERLS